ncbi:MAG: ribonuclease Z [Deltaproteobacteria bacterium]|nr:ribonuclease Z [Deltaproteobacteria bacterium]
MRSVFFPQLINGPFGDPALYVRLAHQGCALLFDCGDIHPLTPRQAVKIRAVFISHAHIDHLIGFGALIRFFLYRETPLLVCGPEGITERIRGQLSGYTWNLIRDYPFHLTVRELQSGYRRDTHFRARTSFHPEEEAPIPLKGDVLLDLSHCFVRAVPLAHGDIPSLAFSLEEPTHIAIHKDALEASGYRPGSWLSEFKELARRTTDPDLLVTVPLDSGGSATLPFGELFQRIAHRERGMKLAYVTDISPTEENLGKIVCLAADSHLLVIEAVFSHHDRHLALERNHLTARMAGELARRCRAARYLLFHHSPRYQGAAEVLEREALRAFHGEAEGGFPV